MGFDFEHENDADVLAKPYELSIRRYSRKDSEELYEVLDLIVAEFESDPHSIQCFDSRIVKRAIAIRNKVRGY